MVPPNPPTWLPPNPPTGLPPNSIKKALPNADMATSKPADRAAAKAADMAPPKSAARSGDEITPNPAYVTASAAKAPSEPSTPRRRDISRRSGQGRRNGKNCGCVQYPTQRASSRHPIVRWQSSSNWRAAESGRSDCRLESADPNRRSGSLRAWVLTRPGRPPRQLRRQLSDPAVSKHESLLLRKRRYRRNEEIGS